MPGKKRYKAAESDDEADEGVVLKVYKNNIYYHGEVQEPDATNFCIKIRELADKYHDTDQKIILHLNTEGGDLFCGIDMYEALRNSKVPVHVIAQSQVCSAGTIILQGAARRFMYATSVLLVHSLSSWQHGHQKPKEIKEELHNTQTLSDIMSEVYQRHTKVSQTNLKKMFNSDRYMRHDECLKLGFVDEIVQEPLIVQ
jgi:ATP-dependent Clp protease protease subunit